MDTTKPGIAWLIFKQNKVSIPLWIQLNPNQNPARSYQNAVSIPLWIQLNQGTGEDKETERICFNSIMDTTKPGEEDAASMSINSFQFHYGYN